MAFIAAIEQRAQPIRQAILNHPFVQGIGRGDLDPERFKFYITQDYAYLIDYARVLALAAARAPQLDTMAWFAKLLDETLNTEMELHRSYCAQFGITRQELAAAQPAPTTIAYTAYLLRTASQGSFGELTAALLPCQWGYWEIGQHLAQQAPPNPRPPIRPMDRNVFLKRVPRFGATSTGNNQPHRQPRKPRRTSGNGTSLPNQPALRIPILGYGLETGAMASLKYLG